MFKCSKCKCKKTENDFSVMKNGKMKKTCVNCAEIYISAKMKKLTIETPQIRKKLNEEFLYHARPAIISYEMKHTFVDIRDRFNPHEDRDISFCNCEYFNNSVY
jgi:NAD-dependent SIR2 family protein deacetylase